MQFSIPADHPCLPGHFPGRPVVPGVLVLDAVLQALARRGVAPARLRLPQVKFVQPLLPGQLAEIMLDGGLHGEGPWRFRVESEGRVIASGIVEARAEASVAAADGKAS